MAEKLGVGYDDLRRDDLVYVSISGFGNEGPYAHKGAYDTVIQAYGGIGWSQGGTGEPGVRAPGARRQGHRAQRVPGDHRRRCWRASAVTAASTCTCRCSTRSCRSCGSTARATTRCSTATARNPRASRPARGRSGSPTGGPSPPRPRTPTSSACAGRSASTGGTTRASPHRRCASRTSTSAAR